MTTTIAEAISKAIKTVAAARGPAKMVGDDAVASAILRLGTMGYEPSEQIVETVRAYLSGYGVLLCGPAGVGKTFLMRCLGVRLRPVDDVLRYGLRDIHNWYEWTDNTNLCIDDLGAEHVVSEYGAKEDLLKLVIAHRAEHQGGRTSITTNMTSDEIAARYGDRTLSRILGMCKPFKLTGGNRREPMPHDASKTAPP